MAKIMQNAKSKYYLSEINLATSKKSLIAICNKLLGFDKLAPFPNIYLIDQLPAISNIYLIDQLPAISNIYLIDQLPAISNIYLIDQLPAISNRPAACYI